jgi:hypothetical protein
MARAVAEAGNTAIGFCGAPFPLPLHSQLMTQQASNNKGFEGHSRVLPQSTQPPEFAGVYHLGVTDWTVRTLPSVAMMMITTSWQRTAKIQLAMPNVGQLKNLSPEFAKSCQWDASRAVIHGMTTR